MYAWIIRITAGTCSARCRLSVEDAVCLRFGFINTTTTSLSNYTGARLAVCLASPAAPARPVRPIRWVCLGSSRSRGAETDAQEPLQKIGFPDVLFLSLDNCHKSPSAPVWAHTTSLCFCARAVPHLSAGRFNVPGGVVGHHGGNRWKI